MEVAKHHGTSSFLNVWYFFYLIHMLLIDVIIIRFFQSIKLIHREMNHEWEEMGFNIQWKKKNSSTLSSSTQLTVNGEIWSNSFDIFITLLSLFLCSARSKGFSFFNIFSHDAYFIKLFHSKFQQFLSKKAIWLT